MCPLKVAGGVGAGVAAGAQVGLHGHWMSGICRHKVEPQAVSVVMSGIYEVRPPPAPLSVPTQLLETA